MKNKKLWIILGVAVVAIVAYLLLSGGKKKQTVSFATAKVERTNIQNTITATGTIEPVTSVTVGTQVSGIVSRLYVDYNSVVKKGQVIAELDKTNLISELNAQRANLTSAQSALNYQQSNYNRYKTLYDKGLVSADEFESARLQYQQASQQVASARESVQRAQTNLGYATITSPIDGVVLNKAVEEGQTVAASFNTPELFTIAQDLTDMRVIADIDEADIGVPRRPVRGARHAGAPAGHHRVERRHLRGGHLRPQRRPEAEARTDGQRHHLHTREERRALRPRQGAALHARRGPAREGADHRRLPGCGQGVDARGQRL